MTRILFLLLTVQLLVSASFGQGTPTKQETLDWISQKLTDALLTNCNEDDEEEYSCIRSFKSLSNGVYTYVKTERGIEEYETKGKPQLTYSNGRFGTKTPTLKREGRWYRDCTFTIDLNRVSGFDGINLTGQKLLQRNCTTRGADPSEAAEYISESDGILELAGGSGKAFNMDESIRKRLTAAVTALKVHNNYDKNEPF